MFYKKQQNKKEDIVDIIYNKISTKEREKKQLIKNIAFFIICIIAIAINFAQLIFIANTYLPWYVYIIANILIIPGTISYWKTINKLYREINS